MNAENARLEAANRGEKNWRQWGPYLSERQWGTVREDYSPGGDAWSFFSHDQARSKAYRWGEDGIAGFSDDKQLLCLAVALWNGHDPILKERLYGLTNSEGNHGEDCKELYYYLDALPTHSYCKMLYKYPHRAFPYEELREENARRGKCDPEFELLDTGLFDDNHYFDVVVEYAKGEPNEILQQITLHNRCHIAAPVHVLPHVWFRNIWSWKTGVAKPSLAELDGRLQIMHPELGAFVAQVLVDGPSAAQGATGKFEWLFCENETNTKRLYGTEAAPGYWKDGINDRVVDGDMNAVNPQHVGTKAAAWCKLSVPAEGKVTIKLRLAPVGSSDLDGDRFDALMKRRKTDADEFYGELQAKLADPDACNVQRQALAGMIWSKQFFYYDVPEWLSGDPTQVPPPEDRKQGRNTVWQHFNSAEILSMPDKWEYPWFAAWDLAFHCIPFSIVDPEFAKEQLMLLTRVWYMHPNGQIPAYEWNFSDVNPPVHAWATWRVYQIDRKTCGGKGDLKFLERVFHKLLLNFTWWVNRKDTEGRNIFQGGFLGLDNIGVFDRSAPLPTGGHINQADGTSWMAMYCLNMLRIALELALHNSSYEDIATKFFEHFLEIAGAMTNIASQGQGLWDEEDKFYYDVLDMPGDEVIPLKVRSMVGLIPLFAVETLEPTLLARLPEFSRRLEWFLKHRPHLARLVSRWNEKGGGERRLLSLLRGHRMKCLLRRMLDETEFLSEYGVRSLSRHHRENPYVFWHDGEPLTVRYQPAESDSFLFGGNSNWRGPIWFPVNYLIIESLQKFHHYYGEDFKVECPTGSGKLCTILEVATELSNRLTRLFLRDENGNRPVFGNLAKMQEDEHFRDYLLFYEFFDGDNGRGAGASHQTGWTGVIAKLLQPRG